MNPPLLFDAHLDIAMNAIEWNRDLTRPLAEVRAREAHLRDKPDRGNGTVSLPELRRARAGLVVATQIARLEHDCYSPVFGWRSPAQAWAMTQAQRAWYRAMEEAGEMVLIHDRAGLDRHLELWETATGTDPLPVGYVLSLEGADSIVTPGHLERAYADGLRAVGPAHYGPGVHAFGTDASGRLPARGVDLVREMDRLGMILDVTHLCDECFWDAMEIFGGTVWASHQLCRALVPHNRQFSDEQLKAVFARGGVAGVALDAWMIVPGWIRRETTPQSSGLKLGHLVDHIDHMCQLAGNALHVGIGSDLDGAFGTEQTPQDLGTIADLQKLTGLLAARGYAEEDIRGIFHGKFLRVLRTAFR